MKVDKDKFHTCGTAVKQVEKVGLSKTAKKSLVLRALADSWTSGFTAESYTKMDKTINYICQKLMKDLQ